MYSGIFKAQYPVLQGRDWIRNISTEDLAVFIDIGLSCAEHGRLGGKALVKKHGNKYMQEIGRRGALITNLKKYFARAILEEQDKIDGTNEKEAVAALLDLDEQDDYGYSEQKNFD